MYTAVIPAKPREPYILDAIRSMQGQSMPPERVVVVVNGAGANESDLIAQIRDHEPSVEVAVTPRPGMAGALALAIAGSTSPFVAFLDADDLWAPDKQRHQVERLLAAPAVDAVSCEAVNFTVDPHGVVREGLVAPARLFAAVTFRRDVFDRFGAPDAAAGHFAWLFRWWSAAQEAGIRTEALDYRGLRRRIHDANSWVTHRADGRARLLAELRRIQADRRHQHARQLAVE